MQPWVRGAVLDLGCGPINIREIVGPGQTYVGVEGDPATLAWLKSRFPEHRFQACNLEREALDLDRRFDTILMLAILEHLEDPGFLLKQLPQYLEPDGRVIATTPTPVGGRIHGIGARFGVFYREALEEHKAFYGARGLERLFAAHGMQIVQYRKFLFGGNQLAVARAQK